jgi:hypothetical protein
MTKNPPMTVIVFEIRSSRVIFGESNLQHSPQCSALLIHLNAGCQGAPPKKFVTTHEAQLVRAHESREHLRIYQDSCKATVFRCLCEQATGMSVSPVQPAGASARGVHCDMHQLDGNVSDMSKP